MDRVAAARENLDQAVQLDLDRDELPPELTDIDTILLLDIIEHLADPKAFMLELRRRMATNARLILTTGDVGIGFSLPGAGA